MENEQNRPPIQTLACPNTDCQLYAHKGLGNLTVRKVYSQAQIRYLRCRACSREFSERKNTALFGTKIAEHKAVSVAEHLAEGVSTKGTSRLVGVSPEAIRRLRSNLGDHAKDLHDEHVQQVEATALQMDERYGYVKSKGQPFWEATAVEPRSRLVLDFVGGRRDERLIKELMATSRERLSDPTDLVLMTDGARSYESLFASTFGQPYRPGRPLARVRENEAAFQSSATGSTAISPTYR